MNGRILLIALALVCAGAEAHTVYRWTDEAGVTHFSTEPPPKGVRAERIQLSGGGRSPRAAAPARVASGGGAPASKSQSKCERLRLTLSQLLTVPDRSEDDPQWRAARDMVERDIARSC